MLKKSLKKIRDNKHNKTRRRSRTTRKIKEGTTKIRVDLRQILITKPIRESIHHYRSDIDLTHYKTSRQSHGFGLSRMDRILEKDLDFPSLLEKEPVELKEAKTADGKPIGTKIDGTMKKMYEIVNGRHRIARAIMEEHKTIQAIII